jgi:hypothetical protein
MTTKEKYAYSLKLTMKNLRNISTKFINAKYRYRIAAGAISFHSRMMLINCIPKLNASLTSPEQILNMQLRPMPLKLPSGWWACPAYLLTNHIHKWDIGF